MPDRGHRRRDRRDDPGRATSATWACPRWAPRPSAARTPCTRSAALQIEYSLMSRGIEAEILPTVRELGISVTAYGVLSRGLLGRAAPASWPRTTRGPGSPGSRARTCSRNLDLLAALEQIAGEHGATAAAARRSPGCCPAATDIIPLIGTKRPGPAGRGARRAGPAAQPGELAALEAAVPAGQVAGDRYDPAQMAALDSERAPARRPDRLDLPDRRDHRALRGPAADSRESWSGSRRFMSASHR